MKHSKFILVTVLAAWGLWAFADDVQPEDRRGKRFSYEIEGKSVSHNYVFGTRLYQQPDIPKPEKSVPYLDAVFGTKITRITDRTKDRFRLKPGRGTYMHPAYPKHNHDNADGSYLLLFGSLGSGKALYDLETFRLVKSLSTKAVGWNHPIDPRWDAHDPNILYYHRRPPTALSMYNVKTDHFRVIRDFCQEYPDAKTIGLEEEGNCSYDSRYFAFLVRAEIGNRRWAHRAVICYDRVEDRIVGRREGRGAGNWVGMSPSGKYVMLGTNPILVFDREFVKPPIKLTHKGGVHCAVGLDDEGREVIFYKGNREFGSAGHGCYAMCDLETGTETVLTDKVGGPSSHYDCSAVFAPGWGLVSTYHSAPEKQTHWTEYSIHLVELTRRKNPPPRIWRICHTHVNRSDYIDAPFATFGRFGRKIFFGSNWGRPRKEGGDIDTYQVELPPGWYEDLMGEEKASRLRKIAREMAKKKW